MSDNFKTIDCSKIKSTHRPTTDFRCPKCGTISLFSDEYENKGYISCSSAKCNANFFHWCPLTKKFECGFPIHINRFDTRSEEFKSGMILSRKSKLSCLIFIIIISLIIINF